MESTKKVQEDLQYMNLQQLEAVLLKIYRCLGNKHLVCTIYPYCFACMGIVRNLCNCRYICVRAIAFKKIQVGGKTFLKMQGGREGLTDNYVMREGGSNRKI